MAWVGVLVVAGALAGCVAEEVAVEDTAQDEATLSLGNLSITPGTFNFGSVVLGSSSASASFVVRNTGTVRTGVLVTTLGGADASSYALASSTCSGRLAAGATCVVAVRFAPASVGAKNASVRVVGLPGGLALATLRGTGVAPGALAITPSLSDFGSVSVGASSATATFTVVNTGGAATGVVAVALAGTDASQFTVLASTCSGVSLAPSASCSIVLRFEPTSAGVKSASLTASAAPGGSATATLTGTGL